MHTNIYKLINIYNIQFKQIVNILSKLIVNARIFIMHLAQYVLPTIKTIKKLDFHEISDFSSKSFVDC